MNTFEGDLRELYTDEDLSETTPVYIYCPMHADRRRPSMRVYPTGAKCFTCGAWLSRRQLIERVEPERITAAKMHSSGRSLKAARPALRVEEIRVLARMAHQSLTRAHRDYYHKRGLDDATIDRHQLGHYGFGYTIPVFDDMGEVVAVKFRRDDALASEDTPKYWGLRSHNEPRVYPWPVTPGESIVLVEGEFDCLILRQRGVNAYTLTSGAASWSKITETTLPPNTLVIVLYDSDAAGEEASAALATHLVKMGYDYSKAGLLVPAPYKDVTELWQNDPNAFNRLAWSYQWTQSTQQTTPLSAVNPS